MSVFYMYDFKDPDKIIQDNNIERLRNKLIRVFVCELSKFGKDTAAIGETCQIRFPIFNDKDLVVEDFELFPIWGVGMFVIRFVHKISGSRAYRTYYPLSNDFDLKKIDWIDLKSLENMQLIYFTPVQIIPITRTPGFENLELVE